MTIQSISLIVGRIRAAIANRASSMLIPAASRIRIRRVTPSTIIGRAVSTGRMRITTDMMTAMTDSGTSGSSENKGFQNFRFQLFFNASLFSYSIIQLSKLQSIYETMIVVLY